MKHPSQLSEFLVQAGILAAPQMEQLLQEQQRWGGRLSQILMEKGLLREEQLVQLFHREMRLPIITLDRLRHIPSDVLKQVPLALCETYDVFPVAYDLQHRRLCVAMSDPSDRQALQALQDVNGMQIEPLVAGTSTIRWAIRVYFYGESMEEGGAPSTRPPSFGGAPPSTGLPGMYANNGATSHFQPPSSPGFPPQSPVAMANQLPMVAHIPGATAGTGSYPRSRAGTGSYVRPSTGIHQHLNGAANHATQPVTGAHPMLPSHHVSPDMSSAHIHSLGRSPAVAGKSTDEARLSNALKELQQTRQEFEQYRMESQRQILELQELVNNRFHEHRMMMRGLFDLLVQHRVLSKEELVQMISAINQQNSH